MEKKVSKLITLAKAYMHKSRDPLHDLNHVSRVEVYASRIAKTHSLSEKEYDALMLAVWWHDVSRSIFPKTSFIWLYFFDDILSACMLWFWSIRYGVFGNVAGIATRIIFCKSNTLGSLFIRIFLRKKTRILLQILDDADALDMMNIERLSILCSLTSYSRRYLFMYKIIGYWWTQKDRLKLYTKEAKNILKELLAQFMIWIHSYPIRSFHEQKFGHIFTNKLHLRWNILEQKLTSHI